MDTQKLILDRISNVLDATSKDHANHLKKLIDESGRIFVGGAGRSLLVARFFAMRLVHAGYQVNMPGEIVTPAIVSGDLLVVNVYQRLRKQRLDEGSRKQSYFLVAR